MSTASIHDAIKKATVAIIAADAARLPLRPFVILGSGFCVHAAGIVVTCGHVFQAFVGRSGGCVGVAP